jgi:hypothetical protein
MMATSLTRTNYRNKKTAWVTTGANYLKWEPIEIIFKKQKELITFKASN